jgi:hypothetical protein
LAINISTNLAPTCDGPTIAPRATAAAKGRPLAWRIVSKWTFNVIDGTGFLAMGRITAPLPRLARQREDIDG